jgi:hypothetical protein
LVAEPGGIVVAMAPGFRMFVMPPPTLIEDR